MDRLIEYLLQYGVIIGIIIMFVPEILGATNMHCIFPEYFIYWRVTGGLIFISSITYKFF